ncbi:delta 12 fatty acid epoxygenase [Vararia minispora EC-137]|uniref:Delta 12 fatty acid epoxygenase n=1 Tax=Vararia minispora EC-137 TaxID=1314806 RepID=A0ACB8QWG2_9AGAM|nr:delta 12 fatty acid epoxygenase [Vararia minispora EC-137]
MATSKLDSTAVVQEFTPFNWSISQIRAAIPAHLFKRHTGRALIYLTRDIVVVFVFWYLATYIESTPVASAAARLGVPVAVLPAIRWALWVVYWWFQGLAFTGIWVIGHECGHQAFSPHAWLNDAVGFVTHTALWTPYFSWRISHHRHHRNHASMEKDEVYVPKTRSDLGLPLEPHGQDGIDYDEILGDTPIYTLGKLLAQQLLAFPAYLLFNVSGQKTYPKWTNHFDPCSILFTPSQRMAVITSNVGIAVMVYIVTLASQTYGTANVVKFYGIPWLLVTHWFIMITYLHHTDQSLPHYRAGQWNYQRGAAATIDRDFLGWHGRFFLHDVAHFHVVHHFFPKMPWYNGEEATKHLRAFLGEHYRFSDAPVFKQLWKTYNDCQFVEDQGELSLYYPGVGLMPLLVGDILFYRDRHGNFTHRATTLQASTAVQ